MATKAANTFRRTWLSLAALVVAAPSTEPGQNAATQGPIRGTVFLDANSSGTRDPGERGLPGVVVSNQNVIVVTSVDGTFQLPSNGLGVVFLSVPDGYRSVGAFWRAVSSAGPGGEIAFALAREANVRSFTFVHASDTHIAPASVERTRRLRTLVDSLHPAFALITGDLVKDALRVGEAEATGYYELFKTESARFHTPLWTVPGNHENFGIEQKLSQVPSTHLLFGRRMYRHYFGPDYYSFTYGGVHFVGLNTVDIDDQSYYGHVDSLQLAWLERDLALVPPSVPVVTFDHIPLISASEVLGGYTEAPPAPTMITVNGRTVFRHTVSNVAEVLAVLRKRRHELALGGHIHAAELLEYETGGQRTRFNQAAAVVGPRPAAGLEFLSGITLYTVRGRVIDHGRFVPLDTK